jgi:hypothetical protein
MVHPDPNHTVQMPTLIAQVKEGIEPRLGPRIVWIPMSLPVYQVGTHSAKLTLIPKGKRMASVRWDEWGEDLVSRANGHICKVCRYEWLK